MILLDTDVAIDLLRQYQPAIAWLGSLGEEEVVLPGFVVMELIQGCRNKREQERVARELSGYEVRWPLPDTCDKALSLFAKLHLSRGPGMIDILIGQMAMDLVLPLYTFNQRHYAAIPKLKTMQPYEKSAKSVY